MGATFSAAVGAIGAVLGGVGLLVSGGDGARELARIVTAAMVWAFPVGVAFSGMLSLTARGRSFEKLSVLRFMALGAGGGVLLFGLLALNAYDAWSLRDALGNLAIFVVMGSGSATGALLLARRAQRSLESSDDPERLGEG